jgi:2-isopropylmalate synthase
MSVEIYDTTLRDGAQGEGLAYSVEDKLKIAHCLDDLGVAYIEGGWPGANPKDVDFFERAKGGTERQSSRFGSTRRQTALPVMIRLQGQSGRNPYMIFGSLGSR